jgi:hypothetical protein
MDVKLGLLIKFAMAIQYPGMDEYSSDGQRSTLPASFMIGIIRPALPRGQERIRSAVWCLSRKNLTVFVCKEYISFFLHKGITTRKAIPVIGDDAFIRIGLIKARRRQ